MRLFDKCVANKLIHPDDAAQSIVLACDPIAEYWHMTDKRQHDGEEFPYCNPPWNLFFIEWNVPDIFRQKDGETINVPGGSERIRQTGAICKVASPKSVAALAGIEKLRGAKLFTAIILRAFIFQSGKVIPWRMPHVMLIEEDGKFHITCDVNDSDHDLGIAHEGAYAEPTDGHVSYLTSIIGCALTFANCCNVKLQDVTDDLQPEPKIRRRLKIPEVKRYTLNIAGHYTTPSRNAGEPQQGVMPFHLCRGHFATYTAEKPMFGNPKLVGRYWHPPHMKGKKERGEIIKDYAITAPPFERNEDENA